MKNVHFNNIDKLSGLIVYQKKKFEKGNFNDDYDRVLEGAGPYVYDKKASRFRRTIVLRLRQNHWLANTEYFKKRFNFKKIIVKYIQDDTVAFEAFKKKQLDLFYFEQGTHHFWDKKTAAPFNDKNLIRVEADYNYPSSWNGIALNMRSGPLSDLRFRQALQFVLNREHFIEKLFNDHYRMVSGPFMQGSKYKYPSLPTPYDPKKASALLKEAGFTNVDDAGYLFRQIKERVRTLRSVQALQLCTPQTITING